MRSIASKTPPSRPTAWLNAICVWPDVTEVYYLTLEKTLEGSHEDGRRFESPTVRVHRDLRFGHTWMSLDPDECLHGVTHEDGTFLAPIDLPKNVDVFDAMALAGYDVQPGPHLVLS